MARIKTGVSKKANRDNLKAFDLVLEWRKTNLAVGWLMTPEVAWAVSGGKFGTAPVMLNAMPLRYAAEGALDIDAMKVALYIVKAGA
jgi:hypothetical protein